MKSMQFSLFWLLFIPSVFSAFHQNDQNIFYTETFAVGEQVILLNATSGKELDFTISGIIQDLKSETANILVEHTKEINPYLRLVLSGSVAGFYDIRVPEEVLEGAILETTKGEDFKVMVSMNIRNILSYQWPRVLPANLDESHTIVSEKNLGAVSWWRMARFVKSKTTGELFYLKLVPKKYLARKPGMVTATLDEHFLHASLKHPRIVKAVGGETAQFYWMMQEVAAHGTLRNLRSLFEGDRLPEEIAAYVLEQVIDAFKYMHSFGVSHNFLNNHRIIFDNDFNIKVTDFGFASYFGCQVPNDEASRFRYNFKFHRLQGLVRPEWENLAVIQFDESTEVYSLGVLLYQILTGRKAKNGINLDIKPEFMSSEAFELISSLIDPEPRQRPQLDQIRASPFIAKYASSFVAASANELAPVAALIKEKLLEQFYLNLFDSSFTFKLGLDADLCRARKIEYLFNFIKPFSMDKFSGWSEIERKIYYHDQATVANGCGVNTISLPKFGVPEYLKISIEDLQAPQLSPDLLQFISQEKWDRFRGAYAEMKRKVKNKKERPLFNDALEPFKYTDLEYRSGDEFVAEAIPTEPLLQEGQLQLKGTKPVLSMPIKVASKQVKKLDSLGRVLCDGRSIDDKSLYLPRECITSPDIVTMAMATMFIENDVNPQRFSDSYFYLTMRESVIPTKDFYGQVGWHVDGAWGAQTARHPDPESPHQGTFSDRNYLIQSSPEMETPFAKLNLDFADYRVAAKKYIERTGIQISPEQAQDQDAELHLMLTGGFCEPPFPPPSLTKIISQQIAQHPESVIHAPHNQLSFFSANAIHTVPVNNSGHEISRCVLRIACSADYFDKAGSPTINPCLGPLGPLLYYPYFDLPAECNGVNQSTVSFPKCTRKPHGLQHKI